MKSFVLNKNIGAAAVFALLVLAVIPAAVVAVDTGSSTGERGMVTADNQTGNRTFEARKMAVQVMLTNAIEKLQAVIDRLDANGQDTTRLKAALATLKTQRDAFVASRNVEEARDAVVKAKRTHDDAREKAKMQAEEVAKRKTAGAIQRARGLLTRLDNLLAKMKEKGVDTTSLEARLATIKADINAADGKYGTNIREAAHLLGDANREFSEFRKELREKAREAEGTPSVTVTASPAP
ncbi:MAG TPA: hypothetical protein VGQ00_04420 [Candidatus Norongarragalinales archaeon]|nr:hypothetical protein [Candidatus Norongarragalinales archaeon]